MKFSTVLGTFAISTLEAYHAYGSPLEGVSLEGRSLQARNTEYCCVVTNSGHHHHSSEFIPWNGDLAEVHGVEGCPIFMQQTSKAPSLGGCAEWSAVIVLPECASVQVSVAPADQCQ
ncbi:uncharacterized protein CPUR_01353 [Claviceps purpurea 20.1]|uniref:Uncharacterized protein n=1 Tax=Claviceps purpurea (strain 20.1) TaxID=1111077 RepID=M1WAT3_CLAP2|nr:hypothetical protein E4U12_004633 [Claviceps purpurea]CCE27879.1 uncharacterized protein CPUR_01353 [Claviceps purpurea 20.1]